MRKYIYILIYQAFSIKTLDSCVILWIYINFAN